MNALEEIIRAEIAAAGPMRFDRFMELALYCPGLGYYARPGMAIGREGDFYTSVSVGPLFGRMLARQFYQMWEKLGSPDLFWIVEQGAHDGRLARDILEWCRIEAPGFPRAIRYGIVQGPHVEGTIAFENLEVLAAEKIEGVFFSNELVDAFPVRVIVLRAGQWRERRIDVNETNLVWVDTAIDDDALTNAIAELPIPAGEGYTTEINLRARDWMFAVAKVLRRGYVLTIDYGYPASLYYAPFRFAGTLTAYEKHQRVDDVLSSPGERDLTAHVDFTSLAQAGQNAGLVTLGFPDQQRFLMGIAHDELSGSSERPVHLQQYIRAWNTLTHPQHLGAKFFALVQARDAPADLDGLRFAGDSGLF